MEKEQKDRLAELGCKGLIFDCPMDRYTTFNVGGPADALCEIHSIECLQRTISYLNKKGIPYLVAGRGSNLLIKDEGIEGVVIMLKGGLSLIEEKSGTQASGEGRISGEGVSAGEEEGIIMAGAGATIADFLSYCRGSGLGGVEFLAGIPGTVGGAIAMNAGAFGGDVGGKVKEIQYVKPSGELVQEEKSSLKFSYRNLQIENGTVITSGSFVLKRDTTGAVSERIRKFLKHRKEKQPIEFPSAGSIFKNPENDYAGRLIEMAGLKGKRIGGAMISERHANYIINTGGATARDILALIEFIKEKVMRDTGMKLEPEIKVIGR